ncbi:hypothetical protein [Herpetosiphon llansteffanensis]|uniref:hypothetical protein n=1 Tax=Herpetosiphon llansteffanensis TaxID=2094568 RepID=UPI000D7C637C|nr:hypothetical protein [Herpetosiphon llansteffanensis]
MSDGFFTLPCRVILPAEQRDRLERLCRARSMEVSDLVSELVVQYLDEVPDAALAEPIPEPYAPSLSEQLRQNERELRRLRMRQNQLGASAPGWLDNYVADIEREIAALRQKLAG